MQYQSSKSRVAITPETIVKVIALLLAVWLLAQIKFVLVLLFIAWLLASTIYPAVSWLEHRKFPRALGILLIYLLIIGVVTGIGILVTNAAIEQIRSLINDLPRLLNRTSEYISRIPGFREDIQLQNILIANVQTLASQGQNILSSTFSYFMNFFQVLLGVITVLVLGFIMLLEPRQLGHAITQLVPADRRGDIRAFLRDVSLGIGRFVRGQTLVAATTAFITWIGLVLLGVPYAAVLGLLTYILDYIPVLGSLISGLVGVLIALSIDPMLALWTALLFIGTNQLEANLIGPLIVGRAVGINPFWIIVSLLIGGSLYGIPGAFLAVPSAIIVKMTIHKFYLQEYLHEGEESNPPPANEAPA